MERYEVAAFIRDARSVTSDPQVEHQMLNALLAHTRGAADRFLDEYFHADNFSHNPFKIAEKQTVSVQSIRFSALATQLSGAMDRAAA